jgi:hypothetical protein
MDCWFGLGNDDLWISFLALKAAPNENGDDTLPLARE